MDITVNAVYKKGVLKPNKRLKLPEGAKVRVTVTPIDADEDFMAKIIGIGASGRTDGAANHDKYIYGKKRP